VLAARGSSDILLSPDFVDRTNGSEVSYIQSYRAAGGGFGNYLALHPYWGVHNKSIGSTLNMIVACNCSQPVWVTEVGAVLRDDQDPGLALGDQGTQNDRVAWMTGPSGLAGNPRIAHIDYYQMRGVGSADFDSGLVNEDTGRRSAWYTWCTATHGGNPRSPDCY
jgi:hypothetical protein